eukprot:2236516-Amphidinium_carterae.2
MLRKHGFSIAAFLGSRVLPCCSMPALHIQPLRFPAGQRARLKTKASCFKGDTMQAPPDWPLRLDLRGALSVWLNSQSLRHVTPDYNTG